jgi:virginiamycin B lyase
LTARTFASSSDSIIVIIIIIILLLATPHIYAQQGGVTIKEWEVPTPNSAPHDIVVDDRNGTVWFTEINANKIGKFDPGTEQFQEFDIPTPSSRPHGLVVDENGNIWFTEMAGSKIGKLDVETGQVD